MVVLFSQFQVELTHDLLCEKFRRTRVNHNCGVLYEKSRTTIPKCGYQLTR